jgi:hypothetical protein
VLRLDASIVSEGPRANVGRPLDFVMLLADAPKGMFWSSLHDGKRLRRLGAHVERWEVAESPVVAESRTVLHRYCYERFEKENRRLAAAEDWPIDGLIPEPEAGDDPTPPSLELLDELWRSKASDAEKQLFYAALQELLTYPEPGAELPPKRTREPKPRFGRRRRRR